MSETKRVIDVQEFKAHTTKDNLWVLLHEKGMFLMRSNVAAENTTSPVYDVSKFIDEVGAHV